MADQTAQAIIVAYAGLKGFHQGVSSQSLS